MNIVLWKLVNGTDQQKARLAELVASRTRSGRMDIVWDDSLSVECVHVDGDDFILISDEVVDGRRRVVVEEVVLDAIVEDDESVFEAHSLDIEII